MFLNPLVQAMKPSATLALAAQARALKAQGKNVISLGAGELDVGTPPFAAQAGMSAIQAGHTKYTPVDGIPELKDAIIQRFKADQGLAYTRDEIVVGTGAKQILFNAFFATLSPGDEVIIPAPYWVSYPVIVSLMGGTPVIPACTEGCRFKLTPDQLESYLTPQTKWLVLNSPNNPTGMVYNAQELEALGAVLQAHPHVWVLSDEIYKDLIFTDTPAPSIGEVCPFLQERLLIINGVSKTYAMTGWRIGYGAGPTTLIKPLSKIQSQQTSGPCSIAQYAALGALTDTSSWRQDLPKTLKSHRDMMVKLFSEDLGLPVCIPEGAFYLFVGLAPLLGQKTPQGKVLESEDDICTYFLDEALVGVVPGAAFGLSPYFRLSYAPSTETLQEAGRRLQQAMTRLKPSST